MVKMLSEASEVVTLPRKMYWIKRKAKFSFLLLLLIAHSCCVHRADFWEEIDLDENGVYLTFRGTKTKEGYLAKDFNLYSSDVSHVGLAIFKEDEWKIFHIINSKDSSDDFRSSSFSSFYNLPKESVYYASIWKVNEISNKDLKQINELVEIYQTKTLEFDKSFSSNNEKFYCSELIINILQHVDSDRFRFVEHQKKLKKLYAAYLAKDTLQYYPVDLFYKNSNFRLVKEWNI